jgi:curved DNA-binding protein CbpA
LTRTTYYEVLEVPTTATKEEIAKGWKRLVRINHPDKNNNSAAASEKTKEINNAYAVLSNEVSRREYDESLVARKAEPTYTAPNANPFYPPQSQPPKTNSSYHSQPQPPKTDSSNDSQSQPPKTGTSNDSQSQAPNVGPFGFFACGSGKRSHVHMSLNESCVHDIVKMLILQAILNEIVRQQSVHSYLLTLLVFDQLRPLSIIDCYQPSIRLRF